MELFVFTLGGLAVAFTLLSLGVLLGRAPLRRGCGSLGAAACDACTRPCRRRAGAAADVPPEDPEEEGP